MTPRAHIRRMLSKPEVRAKAHDLPVAAAARVLLAKPEPIAETKLER